MRKTRSDAAFLALEGLEEDEQRQVVEWLLTPQLGYQKVAALVKKEFGLPCNYGALDEFYQSYVAPFLIKKRSLAVGVAQEVGREVRATPGEFSEATIDALEQKAFELANNPMVDAKSIKSVFTLILKARDQSLKKQDIEIKLRRLQLLEKNTQEAKEKLTAVAAKGGLSAETLKEIERAAKILS